VILQRPAPIVGPDGMISPTAGMNVTLGVLYLSPQSAKDLLFILQSNIEQLEKEFGVIETPYTKRERAAKNSNA
jgi:hypothetical protein